MSITGWENIRGWFYDNDANLYDMAVKKFPDGSRFVEVGSWCGRSSLAMVDSILRHDKQIVFYCLDHFEGSSEHQVGGWAEDSSVVNKTLYQEYCKNIEAYKEYIHTMNMPSKEGCIGFEDNSIDFVYIDASHEYEYVKKDIDIWSEKVKPGGIISGHDWGWEGVQSAVIDFCKEKNYYINNEFDSSWYVYKR